MSNLQEPISVTIALAREVQELRAEVERLTAENARIQRIAHAAGVVDLLNAERALADQLADAVQLAFDKLDDYVTDETDRHVLRAALAAWEAARHEGQP